MTLLLAALALLGLGGLAALATNHRHPRLALQLATVITAAGAVVGLIAALFALGRSPETLRLAWNLPWGELHLRLDPLSAFFEVALFALVLPASIYGSRYMLPHLGRRSLGVFLFFFDLFLVALSLVFVARDAVFFLIAWEVMTVAAFALITFEHDQMEVRRAGFVFLVASHLGTAFIFALFFLLGHHAGSFDMDRFLEARAALAAPSLLFVLALVGFGTKAGLVPLHVWLPEAHPAAPSHVSALLSGVMIKSGIYGLLRTLEFLPPAPAGWGYVLFTVGMLSALVAIILALGQCDLKRVLAYSSVENMGIVAMGIGLGLAARAHGATATATLGFAAALFHIWNHAVMKGLAFMGAGALAHATHTRDLEQMGGLLKRLPITGGLFLLGCTALSALPPLNGFFSEWLLYLGLLSGPTSTPASAPSLLAALGVAGLALVGAVAAVAFTRLAGAALLGEPRSEAARHAQESDPWLWRPLAFLAGGSVLLGLLPDQALRLLAPALAQVGGEAVGPLQDPMVAATVHSIAGPMRIATLLLVVVGFALYRYRQRSGQQTAASETWGCGFSRPTPRMEYTASSFAQFFLSGLVPQSLRPRGLAEPPSGLFPRHATLSTESQDPARARLFDPLFRTLADRFAPLRRFHAERLSLQLFYTVAALLVLGVALWLRRVWS